MTEPQPRRMLSFVDGTCKFQLRAAAIILRDDHVLIHRAITESSWSLPGGRVEMGESGATTLRREMLEELGVEAQVGPLQLLIENFFPDGRGEVHELGLYYATSIPDAFPFRTDAPCHRAEDGGATIEFQWVRNDPAVLSGMPLFPEALRVRLGAAITSPVHLVVDDR